MRIKAIVVIFFFFEANILFGQNQISHWDKWQFLIGEWVGEGNGKPGMGNGEFSFKPDLDGKILVRKSHTEFPPANNRPALNHDDIMIVYANDSGIPSKAVYFDNENHTINYTVSDSSDSIILTSELMKNVPQFRLTYTKLDGKKINVRFEIASPQKPEDFKTYLEGQALRK